MYPSVIERYVDGAALEDGFCRGLRIDVADGAFAYRTGVRPEERADVVIEVVALTARRLNLMLSADPAYRRVLAEAVARGELRISGEAFFTHSCSVCGTQLIFSAMETIVAHCDG